MSRLARSDRSAARLPAFPYADEDAQGNLRIVALPIMVMPREWLGVRMADVLPGMVWSTDA